MKFSCLVLALVLCMSVVAFADEIPNLATQNETVEKGIPNLATDDNLLINGRPQKLDKHGDKDGDQLNPVERSIVIRNAIKSNAPALKN